LALLVAVYFGAAKLGLTMAFVAEQVTAVWPPAGIALAALLLFGYRLWPGIAIGAFLANVTANTPLATAMGIALGNTLEALAGAWMLRRLIQFDSALGRVKEVLGLVVLVAGLSTMVSATIGVTSLCMGGVKPWMAYREMWSVWWLGDAMGDLVVAPLLLTWAGWYRIRWRPQRVAELGVLLLALIGVSLSVFAGPFALVSHPALAYALFPFMIWAALRFRQPAASLATAVASSIAIWGTVHGFGTFHAPTADESLILLQLFMGVVATTTLVLAAVTTERAGVEESLQQSYDLVRAVVEGTTDAVFVKDRHGRYLMINASGAGFLGTTVAEVIGKDDTQLFSPQSARAIMEGDRRIMATGEIQTFEDVGTAAGVTRTYLSTKGPYRDAHGTIVGVLGIARDITERKRRERRLTTEHGVTSALAESATLEDAAPKVLKTVGETLGCDLGVLWEVGLAPVVLRCVAVWRPPGIAVTDFEQHGRQLAFARGEGLPGRAWDSDQPVWVPDAPFPRSVAAQRAGPCSAVAFPLRSNGDVLGVVEFFSPELRQPEEAVLAMMASIGVQVGQFIERRKAEMALHARDREFQLARAIQQGLLPKAPPILAGFAIAGATHPTQETGGDYYDFIPMSDGYWGIVVGDASGHGIGAALLISETRAYLRALALTHTDPGSVLRLLNYRLAEDMSTDHFVTVLFARLCPVTRSLVYSNAGHWPGYVLDAHGEVKLVLNSTNLPLGLDAAGDFSNGPTMTLDPGDLVFLLSDGIVEAVSADGSPFNIGRALEVVRAHRDHPPGELIAALLHQVREWSQSAQADDMTAVVIKVRG